MFIRVFVYPCYMFYLNVFPVSYTCKNVSDTCKIWKHVLQIRVDTHKHETRIIKTHIRKNSCRFRVVSPYRVQNCQVYIWVTKYYLVKRSEGLLQLLPKRHLNLCFVNPYKKLFIGFWSTIMILGPEVPDNLKCD